ncbi:MAG: phosphate ABC transporter permease subunit PstC [Myxococcota bacterium]
MKLGHRGKSSTTPLELVIRLGLIFCGFLAILVTAGIIGVLAFETIEFFTEVSIVEFFTETKWTPTFLSKKYGIWPLITGTLLIAAIAMAVALPFGLLAAIYLSEYANPTTRKVLKPALELLAGVPTIVYGFFALAIVTPFLQKIIPNLEGFNALSPGIVMGIMIIPMISSLSEDAIYSVPNSLREASYGLGASKLPTVFRVVIPAAWSGIAASVTLAVSRAIGETMIVAVAAGQLPRIAHDPRESLQTMTAYIVNMAKGDVEHNSPTYRTLFAVGSVLFLLTLVMNLLSYRLSKKIRDRGRK